MAKLELRGRQEIGESRRWPPSISPVPIFTASGTTRSDQATVQIQRLIPDNFLHPAREAARSEPFACPVQPNLRRVDKYFGGSSSLLTGSVNHHCSRDINRIERFLSRVGCAPPPLPAEEGCRGAECPRPLHRTHCYGHGPGPVILSFPSERVAVHSARSASRPTCTARPRLCRQAPKGVAGDCAGPGPLEPTGDRTHVPHPVGCLELAGEQRGSNRSRA